MQQSIAPALLQIPVVQTRQEYFIRRVGNDTICLIFALGNYRQLSINNAGVVSGEGVNGEDDLEDEVITLLPVVEIVLAGIL